MEVYVPHLLEPHDCSVFGWYYTVPFCDELLSKFYSYITAKELLKGVTAIIQFLLFIIYHLGLNTNRLPLTIRLS